jgi:hypothetical protein
VTTRRRYGLRRLIAWMPPHVRFLGLHALVGFGLASVFVAAVIWSNAFGLGRLLLDTALHPMPVLLLWFFTGLTFGSVQMGAAVMFQNDVLFRDPDEDEPFY